MSQLTYNLLENDIMVEPEGVTLREFYIAKRKASGITIAGLERKAGVDHPLLYRVEKPQAGAKPAKSVRIILAGLEALGYTIKIKEGGRVDHG